ncbi:MAG TPA: methylated-DNA--[protein]-cysteine S-methyltransferase [Solirubrobacteraceae bacterium]|nr:methylated-DNA--[protein]-cysteine S-methyltransferase [Solirubrobacteraceae bacterium]
MTSAVLYAWLESPVGRLLAAGDEEGLLSLSIEGQRWTSGVGAGWRRAEAPFTELRRQLGEYFAGERREFELSLRFGGSEFRRRVWETLRAIPFGETRSYGQLARSVGSPGAARAVGLANGRNPFAIVVPCHRVIGADGTLVGYGGGLERKRWLLDHERRFTGS